MLPLPLSCRPRHKRRSAITEFQESRRDIPRPLLEGVFTVAERGSCVKMSWPSASPAYITASYSVIPSVPTVLSITRLFPTWDSFLSDFLWSPVYDGNRGSTVVKVLCYKSEGHWFDSRWCHWNFSLMSLRSHYGPGVESASNRNEYQEYFLGVKAAGA